MANLRQKLAILADAAKYDASCASGGSVRKGAAGALGSVTPSGICHSYTPDGRCVSLLRILLTNVCVYDCQYCVNRVSSDIPRATFQPEEVVELTLDFYRRNYIEGLFLSSGVVGSPDDTMERMIRVARSLREEHGFRGYIHLKVVPGASAGLLLEAGRHADRLSANIELPTAEDLARLAPEKRVSDVHDAMETLATRIVEAEAEPDSGSFVPAGQTTQMIVGATDTDDATILATADRLYRKHALRRVYYSGYSPIPTPDARLPAAPPPLAREHRLYEADWLLRKYGFTLDELLAPGQRALDPDVDPKLAWALRTRAFFPVDVNRADREALLRVPGFGPRSVKKILAMRRHRALTLADLKKLRVSLEKVSPFVVAAGHVPRVLDGARLPARARQLSLFGSDA